MPTHPGRCCHDHDCSGAECASSYSLYQHIDIDRVVCLNESGVSNRRAIFKPWDRRTDNSNGVLLSNEDDCELLLQIPFHGSVNLKAFSIIGGTDLKSPCRMRAFVNRDGLDFQSIEDISPVQEWDLQEDFRGILEYSTIAMKFKGVHFLTLHFPETFGASQMEIRFLGLKGDLIERRKEAVQAVYESKPMPEDHQVPGDEQGSVWRTGM